MVRKKTIQFLLANGKRTRTTVIIKTNKTTHWTKTKNKEITFFPNWQITKKNQIKLKSRLPKIQKLDDNIGKWKISAISENEYKLRQNKLILEKKSKSCGKLFCLAYRENYLPKMTEATCFLVEFQNFEKKIVTCLHAVNEFPLEKYKVYFFVAFSYDDYLFDYMHCISQNNTDIGDIRKIVKGKFFEVQLPKKEFFLQRKNFMTTIYNSNREKIFLDPEFELQPMPTLDIAFIDLTEELINKIEQNFLIPLKISLSENLPKIVYLIAFHSQKEFLFIKGKKNENLEYFLTDLPNEDLEMSLFVNREKSIGECQISKSNSFLITYLGTTGLGSSGGCLLDEKGDIVGINFGNYLDIEKVGEDKSGAENIFDFDKIIDCENKNNYFLQKNVNLAINIKHPFVNYYLQNKPIDIESLNDYCSVKPKKINNFVQNSERLIRRKRNYKEVNDSFEKDKVYKWDFIPKTASNKKRKIKIDENE